MTTNKRIKYPTKEKPVNVYVFNSREAIEVIDKQLPKDHNNYEYVPFARNISYAELSNVIPDKLGEWVSPVALILSRHKTTNKIHKLCEEMSKFLMAGQSENPVDIMSISAYIVEDAIILQTVVRYYAILPSMKEFYNWINESAIAPQKEQIKGTLIIPEDVKDISFNDEEIRLHSQKIETQNLMLNNATKESPFLNSIDEYTRLNIDNVSDFVAPIYDLKSRDMQMETVLKYDDFIDVFASIMRNYITGTEYNYYVSVLKGNSDKNKFINDLKIYIKREFVATNKLPLEDLPAMMNKLNRALFELYIVQDLINDPDITDIKITNYDSIRVRVHGKAYLSNITFLDLSDYMRFLDNIIIKNNIDTRIPSQTFTDQHDSDYVLRFSYTSAYINSPSVPILHIRKVSRKKLLGDDLIKANMMTPKVRDYLLDCGKTSGGIVFSGPPGSGKTVALNWFLEEAYEDSAEILCIQENDELFAYRKGVMFEHVVSNPSRGEQAVTLEQLGSLALVAGANVFIIGEAKGAEICSAITLSNSGCRTAITIHSNSATDTIDKMADLAMRGYAQSYEQAKRMLKTFDTIVYLQDFKIQEIVRIKGFNETTKDMDYQYIYRRELDVIGNNNDTGE